MANPAGWSNALCSFAKKQGRSHIAEKIQNANAMKTGIGKMLSINNAFRNSLIDAYKTIENDIARRARVPSLDIAISNVLQDCSLIM